MSINWDKVKIEADLITLPDVYWRLRDIVDGPEYEMQQVTDLIGCDPGLTARLLRLVNSAFFGFPSTVETVGHAISIVGVRQVEELVLTTSVADTLGDYQCETLDVKQFWVWSIYRAICARKLATDCNVINSERLFVSGLLSGVGQLIMYRSVPVLAQRAQDMAEATGMPLHLAEREVAGFDHAGIAAILLENWKLPDSQVLAVKNHLQPDPAANFFLETAITHIGVVLANGIAADLPMEESFSRIDPRAWDITGLEPAGCPAIQDLVAEQFSEFISLLFPKLRFAAGR